MHVLSIPRFASPRLCQVQIGDAQILPSFDSAHLEIGRVMQRLRREEVKACRRKRGQSGSPHSNYSASLLAEIQGHNVVTSEYEEQEQEVGLNRAIIVHIYSPLVPTLNLVDLPGLLPSPMQEQGRAEEEGEMLSPPTLRLAKSTSCDSQYRGNSSTSASSGVTKSRRHSSSSRSTSSSGSVWVGTSPRSSTISSDIGNDSSFAQESNQRRPSFSQRQTWQSVTAAERRLEIVERYILSYPDSLYLLLTKPAAAGVGTGGVERICTSAQKQQQLLFDPSLQELVCHYELQVC